MKTKTRILSALLTVFLLLSALATGSVAAEDAPAMPGKVLYRETFDETLSQRLGWKDVTTGEYAGVMGKDYLAAIVDTDALGKSSRSLFIESLNFSRWRTIELVSAEKMAGVTKYTLSMTAKVTTGGAVTWHDMLDFRFGAENADAALGDWVGIRHGTDKSGNVSFENRGYTYEGASAAATQSTFPVGSVISFSVKVDTEARTVDVYKNDEAHTLISHRENCSPVVGPIYMVMSRMYGWIDDLSVVNDATGKTIWSEDFESVQNVHLMKDMEYDGALDTIYTADGKLNINRPEDKKYKNGETDGNEWGGVREVMPASALEGVKKYVISYDLTVGQTWNNLFLMTFGANSSKERNVVGFHFDANGDVFSNLLGNQEELCRADYRTLASKPMYVQFEVDATTGVATLWLNGVKRGSLTNTTFKNGGIGFGATSHTVATVDNLVVTAGTVSDLYEQIRYLGVQESAVKDGTYAVRFVGALGDDVALADYSEVGFKVTATWGADGTKTLDTACSTVYGKITGSADGVTSEYRADSFGAKYLFALAVEGIPTDAGQITFTVTPYYVTADGTVTGNACTVIYNAGALVSQTAN